MSCFGCWCFIRFARLLCCGDLVVRFCSLLNVCGSYGLGLMVFVWGVYVGLLLIVAVCCLLCCWVCLLGLFWAGLFCWLFVCVWCALFVSLIMLSSVFLGCICLLVVVDLLCDWLVVCRLIVLVPLAVRCCFGRIAGCVWCCDIDFG